MPRRQLRLTHSQKVLAHLIPGVSIHETIISSLTLFRPLGVLILKPVGYELN